MTFPDFFVAVRDAQFGFGVIRDWVVNIYTQIAANEAIVKIWDAICRFVAPYYKPLMGVIILLAVFMAFFGKKFSGLIKFVALSVAGFALGVQYLAPIIPAGIKIPPWVVGIVVGILAGVLYKFIYIILYAIVFGYGTYILAFHGFYLNTNVIISKNNIFISIIIAGIILAVALILRKYIEMFATAALGGYLAAILFNNCIYAYANAGAFAGKGWIAILVVSAVIAVAGAIVQFKTRRRY